MDKSDAHIASLATIITITTEDVVIYPPRYTLVCGDRCRVHGEHVTVVGNGNIVSGTSMTAAGNANIVLPTTDPALPNLNIEVPDGKRLTLTKTAHVSVVGEIYKEPLRVPPGHVQRVKVPPFDVSDDNAAYIAATYVPSVLRLGTARATCMNLYGSTSKHTPASAAYWDRYMAAQDAWLTATVFNGDGKNTSARGVVQLLPTRSFPAPPPGGGDLDVRSKAGRPTTLFARVTSRSLLHRYWSSETVALHMFMAGRQEGEDDSDTRSQYKDAIPRVLIGRHAASVNGVSVDFETLAQQLGLTV